MVKQIKNLQSKGQKKIKPKDLPQKQKSLGDTGLESELQELINYNGKQLIQELFLPKIKDYKLGNGHD